MFYEINEVLLNLDRIQCIDRDGIEFGGSDRMSLTPEEITKLKVFIEVVGLQPTRHFSQMYHPGWGWYVAGKRIGDATNPAFDAQGSV